MHSQDSYHQVRNVVQILFCFKFQTQEEIEEQENTIRELERALKAKENPLKVKKLFILKDFVSSEGGPQLFFHDSKACQKFFDLVSIKHNLTLPSLA